MDDTLQKALRRREELQQELKFLGDFITVHEKAQQLLAGVELEHPPEQIGTDAERSPGGIEPSSPARPQDSAEAGKDVKAPKRSRVTDNPKPAGVVRESIVILRERGHPLSRRELHTALAERGLEVKGADPIKALGTMLWRAPDQLVQLEGFGYWPKGEAYHPAGYYPSLFPEGTGVVTSDRETELLP